MCEDRQSLVRLATVRNYNGPRKKGTWEPFSHLTTVGHRVKIRTLGNRLVFNDGRRVPGGAVCHVIPFCDGPTRNVDGGSQLHTT